MTPNRNVNDNGSAQSPLLRPSSHCRMVEHPTRATRTTANGGFPRADAVLRWSSVWLKLHKWPGCSRTLRCSQLLQHIPQASDCRNRHAIHWQVLNLPEVGRSIKQRSELGVLATCNKGQGVLLSAVIKVLRVADATRATAAGTHSMLQAYDVLRTWPEWPE